MLTIGFIDIKRGELLKLGLHLDYVDQWLLFEIRQLEPTLPREIHSRSQNLRSPLPAVGKREFWKQPFQVCAINADCAVKPDGQNSVISSVISKWLLPLPELTCSDRWSRGTKAQGTRLCEIPIKKKKLANKYCHR